MANVNSKPSNSECPVTTDTPLHSEIERIIGNARFEHNVCLMARNKYGMAEFGRLFYLLLDLDDGTLGRYLDLIDGVRKGHDLCLRCSLKFVAFCRFFCGLQLPQRLASYEREYSRLFEMFGPGRDFMFEVWEAIDLARPVVAPPPPPNSRLRSRAFFVYPTDIRFFRGDFDR